MQKTCSIFELLDALEAGIASMRANGRPALPQGITTIRPQDLDLEMSHAGVSRNEFSALFGVHLNVLQDWLAGHQPVPGWVPISIHLLGLLPPHTRRRLLSGPETQTSPSKVHPFSRIEEL